MNDGLKIILTFALGAAAGSVVTWKLCKTKYEQIAQEEIDSVKEVFSKRMSQIDEFITKEDPEEDPEKKEYLTIVSKYTTNGNEEKGGSNTMDVGTTPYVISPDEFDELDEYDTSSLTYYADGILADEFDEVIEDVDEIIGMDSLHHFGEFEDDSVFVRNDRLRCDYEILLDHRNYSDLHPVNEVAGPEMWVNE